MSDSQYNIYSAIEVANTFLHKADQKNIEIQPAKLQLLVYFAHAWHLAMTEHPLIDELIYATKSGPLIIELFQEFKQYGELPIPIAPQAETEPAQSISTSMDSMWPSSNSLQQGLDANSDKLSKNTYQPEPIIDANDREAIGVFNHVFSLYADKDLVTLQNAATGDLSAWDKAKEAHQYGKLKYVLPNFLIEVCMQRKHNIEPMELYLASKEKRISHEPSVA